MILLTQETKVKSMDKKEQLEISSFKSQRAVLYSELVISAEFGILSVQCSGLLYFLYSVF